MYEIVLSIFFLTLTRVLAGTVLDSDQVGFLRLQILDLSLGSNQKYQVQQGWRYSLLNRQRPDYMRMVLRERGTARDIPWASGGTVDRRR